MQHMTNVAKAILGVGFVQLLVFSPSSTQALTQGDTWETKAPVPIATSGMEGGFATLGGGEGRVS